MATYEHLGHDFEHGEPVKHKDAIKYGYYDGIHLASKYAAIAGLALAAWLVIPKKTLNKAVSNIRKLV